MPTGSALLDLHTRLAGAGRAPRPLDGAALAALERTLGAALPEELRHALSVWGESLRELAPVHTALAASTRAAEPFPHTLADARDAMRPGEYVFLDTFDPPGTWLLADLDGVEVHLVVTGEARGSVWLATPHGLAPAYAMVDDAPAQHGFASWYLEQLGPADAEGASSPEAAAAPDAEPADEAPVASALPVGDVDALLGLCSARASTDAPITLPAGRYELAVTIVIEQDVALDGAGQVQIVAPTGAPAFDVRAGRLALGDLEIEGGIPGQVVPGEIGLVVDGEGAAVHLERVVLRALVAGVEAGGGAALLVRGCTFSLCGRGVGVRGRARLEVHGSRFEGGDEGVLVEQAAHVRLARCHFGWATDGVRITSSENVSIEACRFEQLGDTAVALHRSHARVEGNALTIVGAGVFVDGGVAHVEGNAITAASLSCVSVRDDAVVVIERNVLGGANYGVHVALGAGGSVTVARNVLRGENLDGIFVGSGLARVVENHVTGGRQFGVNADDSWVTVARNEVYRMGRAAFELPEGADATGNVGYDCDWEEGRKPKGARFPSLPRDEPGVASRACAATGVPCVGPARVFVVDCASPTQPIAPPILVTVSGGVVVRAEARPEHEALCAWLGVGRQELASVVERLLGDGISVGGHSIGAVLVDDGFYLAVAAASSVATTSTDELLDEAFAEPAAVRAMLGARVLDDDALRARLATLRGFLRGGGLGGGTSARGLLVGAVMDGRTEASWFDGSCGPEEAAQGCVFPDEAALDALRAAPASRAPRSAAAHPTDGDETWTPWPALPGAWVAPTAGVDLGAWLVEAAAAFPRTGRWPLLLGELADLGEIDPDRSRGRASAQAFLRSRWEEEWERLATDDDGDPDAEQEAEARRTLAPFAEAFPGVAPAVDASAEIPLANAIQHVIDRMGALDQGDHAFRMLVPCDAPGDALSVLGWEGTANHYLEPEGLAALLEAWRVRFGAVPIALTGDTLDFAVTRPPTDAAHATQLAAEHFAACPDLVHQGAGTLAALADGLRARHAWWFWWD